MTTLNNINIKGSVPFEKETETSLASSSSQEISRPHMSPRSFRLKSTASEDIEKILKIASWDHSGGKRWDIFAYCFRCLKYSLRRDHHNSRNKTKSHRQQTHSPAIGLMCCPAGMVERRNKGIGSQAQRTHVCAHHRDTQGAKALETKPLLSGGKTYRKLSKWVGGWVGGVRKHSTWHLLDL